jgi:hypothetical protein
VSVQIVTQKQFQTALTNYLNGYTDASGITWPGVLTQAYLTPPVVAWSYQGAPRPPFPYISLNIIGKADVGEGYESPAVPVRDASGNITGYTQAVFWDEDHTVSVQGHGATAPDILDVIHNSLKAPWWLDVLRSTGLAPRDHTAPRDISNIIDDQPEVRWVMEITFGMPAEIDQPQAPWIEFVQLTENYAMPDSTPAVPDVVTTGPVTVGQ